jgi:hypothetical protein
MWAVVMSAVLMMSCAHERVRTVWSQGYNRVTPKNEFRIGNAGWLKKKLDKLSMPQQPNG